MYIGIFGCTADPFTKAHLAIVKRMLGVEGGERLCDKLYVAPTVVDYHREGKVPWLSCEEKLDLINAMIFNDPDIKAMPLTKMTPYSIWDNDLRLRNMCNCNPVLYDRFIANRRFIDTLIEIKSHCEVDGIRNNYCVVLGSDSYKNFKTWYMWREILNLATIVVITGRNGEEFKMDPEVPCVVASIDEKYAGVSGTNVREEWRSRGYKAYRDYIVENICSGEIMLRTPIFNVTKGPAAPNGLEPYKVVAPDWVTIIVEYGGQFLMERQYRYGIRKESLEFPCGMVEKGESPVNAAVRELREETGIDVSPRSLVEIGCYSPNPAFMTNHMYYFFVNLDTAKFVQTEKQFDQFEDIKTELMDKDKAEKTIRDNSDSSVLMIAAFDLYNSIEKRMRE